MKEKMDEASKKALIAYRIKRAYETLKEADVMKREGFIMPQSIGCITLVIITTSRRKHIAE